MQAMRLKFFPLVLLAALPLCLPLATLAQSGADTIKKIEEYRQALAGGNPEIGRAHV